MEQLNKKLKRAVKINKLIDTFILLIFLFLLLNLFLFYLDYHRQTSKGFDYIKYINFDELLQINKDTVGWITIDDTHIDHPIVQGKDNFEYLTKDFYGKFYAGGTIFLDCENNKDFSDSYNIVHGHHMSGGAMFGDLGNFKDKKYFDSHKTGKLLTPSYDYDLKIVATATVDAYNDKIYNVHINNNIHIDEIQSIALYQRQNILYDDKILVLSTCSGNMNTERTILICKMVNKKIHE